MSFTDSYQKRYNDILLTIPEVNNKAAYMAFYRGLTYGKLKKTLVLEIPLSKDEFTTRVRQYVELEELKNKEGQNKDLRDIPEKGDDQRRPERPQFGMEGIQRDGDWVPRGETMSFYPKKG
ncbi:hypothetical protein LIER_17602 [Lithospermum erythrorhizon]|uniref:Uncharacterized protein n=1 Tax=Lithospermum erythrorhizon TaxID=34254 RepID=A0AAV3QAW3_LITER